MPMLAWHHPSFHPHNLWALHFPPRVTNFLFIVIPIPIVLLWHACHTTMSSCCHDNKPFRFKASLSSFIVVYVLHFVSHSLATSPSFISLRACAHCRMFSQQLLFFSNAFVVDQLHQLDTIVVGAPTTFDPMCALPNLKVLHCL